LHRRCVDEGGAVQNQRHYQSLTLALLCLLFLSGLSCRRQESPQIAFEHAQEAFLRGDLEQSQQLAQRYSQEFQFDRNWSWKFRLLEAKSALWRGFFIKALDLLAAESPAAATKDSQIEQMAIQGASLARLHRFSEAEKILASPLEDCRTSWEQSCADALLARGVLGDQEGKLEEAKQAFLLSLQAGRDHYDDFLEATALLNLGAIALHEERFDETIDWHTAALKTASRHGFGNTIRTSLGNLGFAYFKLGDMDQGLEYTRQAEDSAHKANNPILDLYWLTNLGYIYAETGKPAQAIESYLRAVRLAQQINSNEGLYNAYRALALVSAANGNLADARNYSNEARALARADHNRFNELYPLLVQGLIAFEMNSPAEAEKIFLEIESDPKSNRSLRWRALHGLARTYEKGKRTRDADLAYRRSIAMFEEDRGAVRRNEGRLPFAGNGTQIYDDYIHFLVAQAKPEEALRWAENSRARTLAEGLQTPLRQITASVLKASAIAQGAQGNILFYWLGEKSSYLWLITSRRVTLFTLPSRTEIEAVSQRYHQSLLGPEDPLQSLDHDGQWLYTTLIAPVSASLTTHKVILIPDGNLNDLNFETLIVPDPKPHFWIEDVTLSNASSLRLLASATRSSLPASERKLLLIGNSVSPADQYPALPRAADQMANVAKHFSSAQRSIFTGAAATPESYLSNSSETFAYVHFVAHGIANRTNPLDSAIVLSRSGVQDDSFKLYARDILNKPLHAELVTISACYGASGRRFRAEGLVGLSWAFLRAGSHHVVGALWEVTDASTDQLMDEFYDELTKGTPPDVALRNAKLSLLHSNYQKAFYWAPFQLYTGS
jgi:CHAT domain-containing protein